MKTRMNENVMNKIEMAELLHVQMVEGKKEINRWGFFANEGDGTYAVYKPERPIIAIGDDYPEEDGPGAIQILPVNEIQEFLDSIGQIRPIALDEIDAHTACGWYYDVNTACCEDANVIAMMDI